MSHLFANIGRYIDLLPILLFVLFVFKDKKTANKGLWVIFFYCVFVAVNDNVLFQLIDDDHFNYVFSTFTLLEFLTFTAFLWCNTNNSLFKKLLVISAILFSFFIGIYFLTVEFNFIDSIPIGVETILVIGFSVYFLYEQVNNSNDLLYNTAEFWIITGFLIYLAGSFFIYIYANHVPVSELKKFWFVTFIFAILKNIFISIAFLVASRKPKIQNPTDYQPFLI
jgi:hypothetical protein